MDTVNMAPKTWTRETGLVEKRDVWTAMKRGFRGRCPRCGEGKLFRAFLKTADNCSVCGLDFTPHRADDLPAYLVIVIVGHIMVPIFLLVETNFSRTGRAADRSKAAAGERRRGRPAMGVTDAWVR